MTVTVESLLLWKTESLTQRCVCVGCQLNSDQALRLLCWKGHVRARDSTRRRTSWQEASEFLCIKTPSCGLLFHVPLSQAEGAAVYSVAIPTSLPCHSNHVATRVDSGHGFYGSLPAPGAQRPATQARRFCNGRLIKLGGSAGAVTERPSIFLQPHWLHTAHRRVLLWVEVGGERRYICDRNPSIELFHRCMSITTETVRWCWCKFACGAGVLGNICVLQNVSPHINPWVGVPFRQ